VINPSFQHFFLNVKQLGKIWFGPFDPRRGVSGDGRRQTTGDTPKRVQSEHNESFFSYSGLK